jgi:hypothetical protein
MLQSGSKLLSVGTTRKEIHSLIIINSGPEQTRGNNQWKQQKKKKYDDLGYPRELFLLIGYLTILAVARLYMASLIVSYIPTT